MNCKGVYMDDVCIYIYGGGGTWAPLITTRERAIQIKKDNPDLIHWNGL
jgi:hypothetical protein